MAAASGVVPSSSTSAVIANLKLLNRDNYEDWSFRVETYLLAEGLWDVVESINAPPENDDKLKAWKKSNAKALYAIQSSCGDDAYSFIKGIREAKEAWTILSFNFKPQAKKDLCILDSFGYNNWRDWMKSYLVAEKLWDAIEPTDDFAEPTSWGQRSVNERALHILQSSCDDKTRPIIQSMTSAKDAWDTLAKRLDVPTKGEHDKIFLELCQKSKWGAAMKLLVEYPEVRSARNHSGMTGLHWAVMHRKVDMIKELVKLMTPEDLEIQDMDGRTAFYSYVVHSSGRYPDEEIEIAKCMVEKSKNLLGIVPENDTSTPLVLAHAMEKGEKLAKYLYSVIPPERLCPKDASEIISAGISLKRFDIAWDLLQRNPKLAFVENMCGEFPFTELADLRSPIFLGGSQLRLWEKWIYNCIEIEPSPTIPDIRITVAEKPENGQANHRLLLSSVKAGLLRRLQVLRGLKIFGINRIYKLKVIHVRIMEFLKCMWDEVRSHPNVQQYDIWERGIFRALERGHNEFVTHVCKETPNLIGFLISSEYGKTILQFAAECRLEKIYSLIYLLGEEDQKQSVGQKDNSNNNMLHTIASFSSAKKIDHIRSAALQMQRELQWFQEVESLARPEDLEVINHTDRMTPRELFTKNHKELAKEAETSMKETAESCTVVGALMVTMMFVVVSTIPGGTNGDTGLPILLYDKVYTIFMVLDAISLVSSTTSVIIFLGILTSRYAEKDFLVSLPTRMIIGLFTLFLGIVAMMIAFSSAMFIMLHGNTSVIIPTVVLASIPVISFIWMQFPFLVEISIFTYGRGIFDKNSVGR